MSDSNQKPRVEDAIQFNKELINNEFVSIEIPGEPFAKQRPRAVRRGKFVKIYTPNETKRYESKVAKVYRNRYGMKQLEDDICVDVEGIFSVPKSAPKKRQEGMLDGTIPHTSKPDCDNMAKVCLDGLNGVAYPDDAAIVKLTVVKKYGSKPMTRITIYKNKIKDQGED